MCLSIVGYVAAAGFGHQAHQQYHQQPQQNDAILRQASDAQEDGHYQYSYETGNGIVAHESGLAGHSVEGAARWVAPDGTPIEFSYTADENGYHPVGSAIPVAPPVPADIARALLWIQSHPFDEAAHNAREARRAGVARSVYPVHTAVPVYRPATPARVVPVKPVYKPVAPVYRAQPAYNKPVANQYNQYRKY